MDGRGGRTTERVVLADKHRRDVFSMTPRGERGVPWSPDEIHVYLLATLLGAVRCGARVVVVVVVAVEAVQAPRQMMDVGRARQAVKQARSWGSPPRRRRLPL